MTKEKYEAAQAIISELNNLDTTIEMAQKCSHWMGLYFEKYSKEELEEIKQQTINNYYKAKKDELERQLAEL